jgi:NAD kinase
VSSLPPRVVVVTRETELDALLKVHGTRGGAAFFLKSRDQKLEDVDHRHQTLNAAVDTTLGQIPLNWRRARVDRDSLDRFLFEPSDIIVTVGQDGLVANVAKYLDDQPVIGIYGSEHAGVLAPHSAAEVGRLLSLVDSKNLDIESRTLVCAKIADGQMLCALNEIFIGHRTHQSARYTITVQGESERHSSSGLIITSGTGATGWAKSVCAARMGAPVLPTPSQRALVYLVREAWPSPMTGCDLVHGVLGEEDALTIRSEMNEGGVLFGDGVEQDYLPLPFGELATIRVASRCLRLLGKPAAPKVPKRGRRMGKAA